MRGRTLMANIAPGYEARFTQALETLAPGAADTFIAFAFGEVLSRPDLDLKTRELATIASLAALGTAPEQLAVHAAGALNAGATRREICEVLVQTALYAGIPAMLNAYRAVQPALSK